MLKKKVGEADAAPTLFLCVYTFTQELLRHRERIR